MKAFIFRSAVKSVRYEVFGTIINMISPIYRHIEESKSTFGLFVTQLVPEVYFSSPLRNGNNKNNVMIAGIPFVLAGQLKTNTPHYIHFF
jgi:hypothetical protein